jgi:hypothetical protein
MKIAKEIHLPFRGSIEALKHSSLWPSLMPGRLGRGGKDDAAFYLYLLDLRLQFFMTYYALIDQDIYQGLADDHFRLQGI